MNTVDCQYGVPSPTKHNYVNSNVTLILPLPRLPLLLSDFSRKDNNGVQSKPAMLLGVEDQPRACCDKQLYLINILWGGCEELSY